MERRESRRIGSGRTPIESRLDLHGKTRQEALQLLRGFLRTSSQQGLKTVLVVTGKGWRDWELEKTDGALRASFRSWLQRKDISPYVADVSQANRGHGGEGAWYVRLRQRPSKAR